MDNQRSREGSGVPAVNSGEGASLAGEALIPSGETGGEAQQAFKPEGSDATAVGETLGEAEGTVGSGSASGVVTPVAMVTDDDKTDASDDVVNGVVKNNNPDRASDDGRIEKVWVDQAKSIVRQTKDDPHARSDGISELRADYMMKRWGRKIGDRN